jgi:hypothetical protein
MYGPMFNTDTQSTWNAALSANSNAIVD